MSNYVPPTTPIGGPAGQPFPPQQPFPPPPQKKSNVMVWVLAGCGTFLVIGVIAVFLGGYFVWNKAKEAGLDPDLMEKHPAVAVAKMMVALNPDIELVSVDEEKQLITVKDKKTGKTVTVNLDQAKRGKITFKGDGEDEEVTLEAKGEGETGSTVVAPQERKEPDKPLEYKLAVINAGGFVRENDITVNRFRYLLRDLQKKTGYTQQQIADLNTYAVDTLRDKYGRNVNLLDFMEQSIRPLSAAKVDYREVVAAMITLMGRGQN